jgi:hypothetical protein
MPEMMWPRGGFSRMGSFIECIAYLYWTNKFIHGYINIYFNFNFTLENPAAYWRNSGRKFGHGFGLKNCSVYKLGYQLEIDHFLSKKKLTWSPPTFLIFKNNRLSVWKMTLFGKKKFGRGSPYILSFLSGFLKGKNGLFVHLWAEQ